MKSFQVLITPDAENDLIELSKYIAQELLSPHVARDYLRLMRAEIRKLSYLATVLRPSRMSLGAVEESVALRLRIS